jgi:YVTN family beta-propeller protein
MKTFQADSAFSRLPLRVLGVAACCALCLAPATARADARPALGSPGQIKWTEKRFNTGSSPSNMAYTPHGTRVYIVNTGSGTVTPIIVSTGKELAPVRVGKGADEIVISPDGRFAFVTNSESNSVTPIRLAGDQALPPVDTDADPRSIVLSWDGKFAYVVTCPATGRGFVDVIDARKMKRVGAIPVGRCPSSVALSANGQVGYATDTLSDSVTPFLVRSRHAEAAIRVGKWPDAIVLTKDGRQAYVANIGSSSVSRLDLIKHKLDGSVTTSGAFEMTLAAAGSRLYVTGSGASDVTVINLKHSLSTFKVSAGKRPWGITATSSGKLVYVTNFAGGSVSVFWAASGRLLAKIPVGRAPDAVIVSPDDRNAFVSNLDSHSVSEIRLLWPQARQG